MLKYQQSLPHLPVNPLDENLDRFLLSTRPFTKYDQYAAKSLESKVAEFRKGLGPVLQKRLEERATTMDHWLQEWWDKDAYMAYRESIVVNVSYFYKWRKELVFSGDLPIEKSITRLPHNQIGARAAQIATRVWSFRHEVEDETLSPDMNRDQPLDMSSYKWMFNACRYPTKPADFSKKFAKEESPYIIIIRKDRYFRMDMSKDNQDIPLELIAKAITNIMDFVGDKAGQNSCLGLLTADNRDCWTDNRNELIKNSDNAKTLEIIEKAAFVICLDDAIPSSEEENNRLGFFSDGSDRFWDKPLQFVVYDNGVVTFNGEHSMMDGTPVARMLTTVTESLASEKNLPKEYNIESENIQKVNELRISIPANMLANARKRFDDLTMTEAIETLDFKGYGKNSIKKWGISPDAYAQMAMQLASARIFLQNGKIDWSKWPVGTYESGATRMYLQGRTETIRSVTEESTEFVETIINTYGSADVNYINLVSLFKKAAMKHVENAKLATSGRGVDRHFFGLKHLLKEKELADLFSDPIFIRSSTWILSTSQINSPLHLVGFGQVCQDGWGIGYDIQDEGIHFTIASKKRQVEDGRDAAVEMKEELAWAMATLGEINDRARM